jgi:hypothetical protein
MRLIQVNRAALEWFEANPAGIKAASEFIKPRAVVTHGVHGGAVAVADQEPRASQASDRSFPTRIQVVGVWMREHHGAHRRWAEPAQFHPSARFARGEA